MSTVVIVQNSDNPPKAGVLPLTTVQTPAEGDFYKTIPLTQGQVALVDNADYEWLSQWKWCAQKGKFTYYAARTLYLGGGRKHQNTRIIYMHWQILNPPPHTQTDHADGNGLNNCRENLRIATQSQNNANGRKQAGTSSQYKGVSWDRIHGKWQTRIQVNGKRIHLGSFDSEEAAGLAYDEAARKYFGEFALTNFKE